MKNKYPAPRSRDNQVTEGVQRRTFATVDISPQPAAEERPRDEFTWDMSEDQPTDLFTSLDEIMGIADTLQDDEVFQ